MYLKDNKIKVGFVSESDFSARLKGIKRGMHPATLRQTIRSIASTGANIAEKEIQERQQALRKAITYIRRSMLKFGKSKSLN